jgi:uncharacterized protein with HEPN domain
MLKRNGDPAYHEDILEACALILGYIHNVRFPEFIADRGIQDKVIFRLIVIGEASKNLSVAFKKQYSIIKWRDMARLRDLAVHHYWNVDALKIWKIAKNDIPQLLDLLAVR